MPVFRGGRAMMHAAKVAAATSMNEAEERAQKCELTGDRRGAFEGYAYAIMFAKGMGFSATASRFLQGLVRNRDPSSQEEAEIVKRLSNGVARDLEVAGTVTLTLRKEDGTAYNIPDRYNHAGEHGYDTIYLRRVVMPKEEYEKVRGPVGDAMAELAGSVSRLPMMRGARTEINYQASGLATFGLSAYSQEHNQRVVEEVNKIIDRLMPKAARRE